MLGHPVPAASQCAAGLAPGMGPSATSRALPGMRVPRATQDTASVVAWQKRGWLRSTVLPRPSTGSKLRQIFLRKGYLKLNHHMPSREKQAAQTERNLICTEWG